MAQRTINIFIDEIYSKPPKKNYITNKTKVYHIDDTWSLDITDLKDYRPENNRGNRYVLVVIDKFSKFVWTISVRNKSAQTITNSSQNILKSSKRKPNLVQTDTGSESVNKLFTNLSNNNNIKR